MGEFSHLSFLSLFICTEPGPDPLSAESLPMAAVLAGWDASCRHTQGGHQTQRTHARHFYRLIINEI